MILPLMLLLVSNLLFEFDNEGESSCAFGTHPISVGPPCGMIGKTLRNLTSRMSNEKTDQKSFKDRVFVIRLAISVHLVACAVTLAASLADRGLLVNPIVSTTVYPFFGIIFWFAFPPFFVCPIVVLFQVFMNRSGRSLKLAILAEALVTYCHMLCMLPACM